MSWPFTSECVLLDSHVEDNPAFMTPLCPKQHSPLYYMLCLQESAGPGSEFIYIWNVLNFYFEHQF